jgi:hypothetical protein
LLKLDVGLTRATFSFAAGMVLAAVNMIDAA